MSDRKAIRSQAREIVGGLNRQRERLLKQRASVVPILVN